MKHIHAKRIAYFPLSLKDSLCTLLILTGVTALCFLLRLFDDSSDYIPMLYVLAVFLISVFTNGYFYGAVSSVLSVLIINYIFTYPYYAFNFSLPGYPLIILCTLIVAIITSMLAAQMKQHSALRLAAEREKMRSNLLRAVSHDLRTPLTSILGASSAIIENDDKLEKEERITLLREIKEDAEWLIRMVENLLSVTRIDQSGATASIVKQPEAAEELVEASVSKFRKRFPDRTVSVQVPEEFLMVPMDAMLIEQVIINLLENAVLHGGTTSQIQLSIFVEKNFAVFEVKDNGRGIPKEILPHIFEGDFRHSFEESGDKKKNMGIGLSVCRTIIQAHNGTMRAYNSKTGGAVFRFTLPLDTTIGGWVESE